MSRFSVSILREPAVSVLARSQFTEPAHLPAQWHGDATDGERLAEYAGRLSSDSLQNPAERDSRDYLAGVLRRSDGHVFAHAHYSLLCEGVSHSLVTALVQHHGSFVYSMWSPRLADNDGVSFVMPPAVIGDASLETSWASQIAAACEQYQQLYGALMTRHAWVNDRVQRRTMARDGAVGVLPASLESKVVVSGSAQLWRQLVTQHAVEGGELEMRRFAVAVLRTMRPEVPVLFNDFEFYQAADRREAARFGSVSG